jgi:hypothetical protein
MSQFLLPSGQFCANLPFLKTMRMEAHIGVLTTIITRVKVDPCTAIIDLSTWMYGIDMQLYVFREVVGEWSFLRVPGNPVQTLTFIFTPREMYLDINRMENLSNGVRELQVQAPNFRFHVHPVARTKRDAGAFIKELCHFSANNYRISE